MTLVENGRALFPDAPTARGAKHMEELVEAKRQGNRVAVLFIIQRPDGKVFSPNEEADPNFSHSLRKAHRVGVEIYANASQFSGSEITLGAPLEVQLNY